jgi:hypothetical protein
MNDIWTLAFVLMGLLLLLGLMWPRGRRKTGRGPWG